MQILTENVSVAVNQQVTKYNPYYCTGFCSGEISCSLLKLSNRKSKNNGVYYTPDITITNADLVVLNNINAQVGQSLGVLTAVKGAYNLSFRGKEKAKIVLQFFEKHPPICGDLVKSRLFLLLKAINILENQPKGIRGENTKQKLEQIRFKLAEIKKTALPIKNFSQKVFNRNKIGHFLSGVLDAEGSVGLKKNGGKSQPFLAIAMKDLKIVEMFHDFLKVGHIHGRPKEKMIHFEIGKRQDVLFALKLFSEVYPSKMEKMQKRIRYVQRNLNDYTLDSVNLLNGDNIV